MRHAATQQEDFAERMVIERVALLYSRATLNQVSSAICLVVMAGVMLHFGATRWLVEWLLFGLGMGALRFVLIWRFPKRIETASRARRWARAFCVGAFVNGVVFVLVSCLLVPPADNAAHLSVVAIGAVLPGMSLTTLACYRPAVISFVVPLLLGYALAAFASDNWLIIGLGGAALIYFAVIVAASAAADRDIRLGLQRSFEIEALNAELLAARAVAESAAASLADQGRELERRVDERTASLMQALRELESFSYSVSHDLRTPLRAISGYSTLLEEDCEGRLGAEGREHLAKIRAATGRLDRLIDELLDLSRLARSEMNVESVDLSALAAAVAAECAGQYPQRTVRLQIQPGLSAQGDPLLLRVVLQNLLSNAWKFTGPTQDAQIRFGAMQQADATVFFVADNGVGFDMAHAENLFKPFHRLHGVSEFAGNGIGLASVARIVARHGGKVWAESVVGEGTRVFFTLGTPRPASEVRAA